MSRGSVAASLVGAFLGALVAASSGCGTEIPGGPNQAMADGSTDQDGKGAAGSGGDTGNTGEIDAAGFGGVAGGGASGGGGAGGGGAGGAGVGDAGVGGGGGAGNCAETSASAQPAPVDMLFLADTAAGMDDDAGRRGSGTKWEITQGALTSFVDDPKSSSLGIGLQFFPYSDDPDDFSPNCDARNYQTPDVPVTMNSPSLSMTFRSSIRSRDTPAGNTPVNYALAGALPYLRSYQAAHTDRRAILVLAIGTSPNACSRDSANSSDADPVEVMGALTQLMTASAATPPINTYVVGIFSDQETASANPLLQQMATAGGSRTPYLLNAGVGFTEGFRAALESIRDGSTLCEFPIKGPTGGAVDFKKLNVRYRGSSGDEDVLYAGALARCDVTKGGWYYDVDPAQQTPRRVVVCDATCARIKADSQASVELRFGCDTKVQ